MTYAIHFFLLLSFPFSLLSLFFFFLFFFDIIRCD
jgi:hypothetical protein